MKQKIVCGFLCICMLFSFTGPINAKENTYNSIDLRKASAVKTKWQKLFDKYRNNDKVNQLIFVKYIKGSKAKVYLYDKTEENTWKRILSCTGYVGKRGINKKREGDKKTPTGTFNITSAYGIKSNPGAKMSYHKVKKYDYWCGDKYYNRLINTKKKPHKCRGERLISYKGHYDYGLFMNFNKKNKKGKGSAIFMHCTGKNKYTAGCIAVKKTYMKKIIRTIEDGTKICIYKK